MKFSLKIYLCITAVSLVFFSCKDTVTNDNANQFIFPDSLIKYGRDVQPLLWARCAIYSCHTQEDKADGLSLYTYEDATSKPGVIIPFDTLNSRLIWRIEPGARGLLRMPLNLPPLTPNQIKGFKKWIIEGAHNN